MGDQLLDGSAVSQQFGWVKIVGILSAVPCAYLWVSMAASVLWKINLPGWPSILIGVLISVPTSIVAAVRWSRWMYLVTAVALSTLLFVALGLH